MHITPQLLEAVCFDSLTDADRQMLIDAGFPGVKDVFDDPNPETKKLAIRRLVEWFLRPPERPYVEAASEEAHLRNQRVGN